MPMIVANNLNALSTGIALNKNNIKLGTSLERLSTGYKINSGKDDPSGLVISEQLRAQNVGLERAVQNTQEANNVLGIAEGALKEMNSILSKMRQLAVHSANSGVTSPEQVAADQAEIDSSVQTLDRIARTTKFSDQNLLNGNKELSFDSTVQVSDSNDHKLLNEELSSVKQIFKKDDFKLNISFSGSTESGSSLKENGNEAQKGYFEITKGKSSATQLTTGKTGTDASKNYTLSDDQAFTIAGSKGSRYLSFAQGTHIGELATSINSVKDSTGVEATIIYDSTATVTEKASVSTQDIDSTTGHTAGRADVFNINALGDITDAGATAINISDASKIKLGQNVDGYGRVYLKMIDDDSYEVYKDESMTMKVAEGDISSNKSTLSASNNSDLSGISMSFTSDVAAGMTSVIQLGVMQEDSDVSTGASIGTDTVNFANMYNASSTDASLATSHFINSGSYLSGVKLGENTDESGKMYVKADLNTTGTSQVFVYKDARMRDEDLVAQSGKVDLTTNTNGVGLRLYGTETATSGETSGLYGTLNFNMKTATQDIAFTTTIDSENIGLRLSSQEYGSDEFVKIKVERGEIFSSYNEQNEAELLGSGEEKTSNGRDATISLNGQELKLDGIKGEVANLDTAATLVMNEGTLGCTTVAAVGYDEGAWGSRAYQMANSTDNYINHAIKTTSESLGDWSGGMQFQLGESASDQDRTVFSIQDVTATELGKTKFTDTFGGNTDTDKFLSINDLLSGSLASLGEDPVKALAIIDQAIEDVSGLRADIGAFQSNMLDTNASSLNVAIENITKTESYIRDADMAKESTEFTSNQIMVQAGTAMLSQANALQKNALSLIS